MRREMLVFDGPAFAGSSLVPACLCHGVRKGEWRPVAARRASRSSRLQDAFRAGLWRGRAEVLASFLFGVLFAVAAAVARWVFW